MGTGWHLVADIGGTNARFALADPEEGVGEAVTLRCADHASIQAAVEHAARLLDARTIEDACLGVASPVTGDRIKITNSPWSFSLRELRDALGLRRLLAVNDFAAQTLGLCTVPEERMRPLGGGRRVPGAPRALLGPGTGLGVACIVGEEGSARNAGPGGEPGDAIVIAGEGGYVTLPVQEDRELAAWHVLRARYGRVSAERVLCGSGLVELHRALLETDGAAAEPIDPRTIVLRALKGEDEACRESVRMFLALLGDVAGNVALTMGARGGVFLSGTLLVAMAELIEGSAFRDRFENKGRGGPFVTDVATTLVLDPLAALAGCWHILAAGTRRTGGAVVGHAA